MLSSCLSCPYVLVEEGLRQYGVLFTASALCLFKSECETGVYTNFCMSANSTECPYVVGFGCQWLGAPL